MVCVSERMRDLRERERERVCVCVCVCVCACVCVCVLCVMHATHISLGLRAGRWDTRGTN